jgi:NAD(P)-dependent dehydrogenase (short-subunit alcohol dehydrogenase family)
MRTDEAPVAVVAGGTGAIGAAICRRLASAGFDIAASYRSREDAAHALISEVEASGRRATALAVDLRHPEGADRLVDHARRNLGSPSVAVYAAGPYVPQTYVSRITPAVFESHVRSELVACFNFVSATLPDLRAEAGSLVVVTSFAARRATVGDTLSAAPKSGMEALVKAVALEEGRFGVRANCVAPGVLEDGIGAALVQNGELGPPTLDRILARVPMRRLGRAGDVAAMVAFLVSHDAGYVSGQCIDVDGGLGV